MSKVRVDPELCMSAQYCLHVAARTFTLDDDQVVALFDEDGLTVGPVELDEERRAEVETAVRNCPSGAIELIDR